MLDLAIQNWRHFKNKAKFEKEWPLFFRSKIGIFNIFLKRPCEERLEDLKFNSN